MFRNQSIGGLGPGSASTLRWLWSIGHDRDRADAFERPTWNRCRTRNVHDPCRDAL